MAKHVIDGVEVDLDPGIAPGDVERYGADSRTEHDDIDLEALEAEAIEDAWLEEPDDDEEAGS